MLLALLTSLAFANEMPFQVGTDLLGFNTPFVSVTVCEPKTNHCQKIDRIKLDTGSSGLRIRKSALGPLKLPPSKNSKGVPLTACATMAGGVGYYGPLVKADVELGDETARGATFQVVDENAATPLCKPFSKDGRNGILGIGTALRLQNGTRLFAKGKLDFMTPPPQNLVSLLDKDKNGFVIDLPEAREKGQPAATGRVIFGVGTQTNNTPPRTAVTCRPRTDEFLQLRYDGKTSLTMFDTGTFAYLFPVAQTWIPKCASGDSYLCPRGDFKKDVEVLNADGSVCAKVGLDVRSYEVGRETVQNHNWVLPKIASSFGGQAAELFVLGLPFFFDRPVYYVLEAQTSPLGNGPIVAFKNN